MPGSWRSYTEAERGAAVARALAIGTKRAAIELNIPRRTLSAWLQRPTPDVQAAIASTRTDVAGSFWRVISEGTDAMLARIHDPKTRAGELAQIVRTAVESHALLTGAATSRVETANLHVTAPADYATLQEERRALEVMEHLAGLDDDALHAWLNDGGLEVLRDAERLRLEENTDVVG